MRHVVILGPGASGKSRLAIHLSDITGLPLIELDKVFWRPGLAATPRDEWVKIQERLVQESGWIMDGDLGPMTPSKFGFMLRIQSFFSTSRSFDALGEQSDDRAERADFWLWLLRYRSRSRPFLMEAIANCAFHATVHVIRSPVELRRFVEAVRRSCGTEEPQAATANHQPRGAVAGDPEPRSRQNII